MTPPKDLNLVASWLALEDVHPDAGPLRYYPGSHIIKPFIFSSGQMTAINNEMHEYRTYMQENIKKRGLKEEIFCAKKGDVFIWHSQLFHCRSEIKQKNLTRRSLVTYYFKEGDINRRDTKKVHDYGFYLNRPAQVVN